jgi:prevent-host-death family protein
MSAREKSSEVTATELKAKCLELMRDLHDRKDTAIHITKRGKPYVKLIPADEGEGSFYACLKGMAKIHGDLTEPTGGDWEALQN